MELHGWWGGATAPMGADRYRHQQRWADGGHDQCLSTEVGPTLRAGCSRPLAWLGRESGHCGRRGHVGQFTAGGAFRRRCQCGGRDGSSNGPGWQGFCEQGVWAQLLDRSLGTNVPWLRSETCSGVVGGGSSHRLSKRIYRFGCGFLVFFTPSGLDQDVVLHEAPPSPAACGLNPQSARLQIWTESFSPPEPRVTTGEQDGIFHDAYLDFGSLVMVPGAALFTQGQADPAPVESGSIFKHWAQVEQRNWLVEEIPFEKIATCCERCLCTPRRESRGKPATNTLLRRNRCDQIPERPCRARLSESRWDRRAPSV